MNTGTSDGTSNIFQILQDLQQKQHQYNSNTVPNMVHTMNIAHMAQPETSFRTTTPSVPATTTATTTKQINAVQVNKNTSWSGHPAHCAHIHKSTVPVCKPGELLALRKVRTLVNRLPLTKQDILSHYSSCFEGIGCFPGDPYKFHLKPEHKPA